MCLRHSEGSRIKKIGLSSLGLGLLLLPILDSDAAETQRAGGALPAGVNPQHCRALLQRRQPEVALPVEAPRPPQRRVDSIGPGGCGSALRGPRSALRSDPKSEPGGHPHHQMRETAGLTPPVG